MYTECTFGIFKRVRTYKLYHLLNSSAAVCTEYILCASECAPLNVPTAYSKSKHSFKSSRFRFPTPFPCRSGLRLGLRLCCRTEGASEGLLCGTATCASGLDDFNMVLSVGYIIGYVDGEIKGRQWIFKEDILIYPKLILVYQNNLTFSNQELIRMYGYDRIR